MRLESTPDLKIAAKQRAARHYNNKFSFPTFKRGVLMLRKVEDARKGMKEAKFIANWKGPYRISKELTKGVYKLEELSRK